MPQDHLGAIHREGGDDHDTTAPGRAGDHVGDDVVGVTLGMVLVSVGRLGDHHVGSPDVGRRQQQRMGGSPEVPAEDHVLVAAGELEMDRGRPEDVSGSTPGRVDVGQNGNRRIERHGHQLTEAVDRILPGVQRERRLVLGVPAPVRVGRLLLVEVTAVGQDDARQLRRARRAVHGSAKARARRGAEDTRSDRCAHVSTALHRSTRVGRGRDPSSGVAGACAPGTGRSRRGPGRRWSRSVTCSPSPFPAPPMNVSTGARPCVVSCMVSGSFIEVGQRRPRSLRLRSSAILGLPLWEQQRKNDPSRRSGPGRGWRRWFFVSANSWSGCGQLARPARPPRATSSAGMPPKPRSWPTSRLC